MSDIVTEDPLNRHVSWEALEHDITPTSAFFCRNHNSFPRTSEAISWNGNRLTRADLNALPQVEHAVTLECAGNGRTEFSPIPGGTPWGIRGLSTGLFCGVALCELLHRFPPSAEDRHLLFTACDEGEVGHYERSLSLEEVEKHSAFLALKMNGEPLPLEHGGPFRVIVPQYYAMASVKWLEKATYSPQPSEGYYQTEDYLIVYPDPDAPPRPATLMRAKSILTSPRESQSLKAEVKFRGKAWSKENKQITVELRLSGPDGVRSLSTQLGPYLGPFAWRSFSAQATLTPGSYSVHAFCTAGEERQPLQARWNSQGYENNSAHAVSFEVVGP